MSDPTPRVRMFAGPNGSGKSTLKVLLRADLLGVYLNPDEIERQLKQSPLSRAPCLNATSGQACSGWRGNWMLTRVSMARV